MWLPLLGWYRNFRFPVLDDLQARKCATVLNLPLIGSLGLIVKAKKEGLLKTVKPAFEKLVISGLYIDKVLIETVLTSLGEQKTVEYTRLTEETN